MEILIVHDNGQRLHGLPDPNGFELGDRRWAWVSLVPDDVSDGAALNTHATGARLVYVDGAKRDEWIANEAPTAAEYETVNGEYNEARHRAVVALCVCTGAVQLKAAADRSQFKAQALTAEAKAWEAARK